jgi:hypothetical protein
MGVQLDQDVDARKSEVSNASKKTRNLRQGSFVRLRFTRKKSDKVMEEMPILLATARGLSSDSLT